MEKRIPLTLIKAGLALVLAMATSSLAADHAAGTRETSLNWEAIEGALSYELDLRHLTGQGTEPVAGSEQRLEKTGYKAWLLPGKYELRLRAIDKRGVPGAWSDFEPFSVKPTTVTAVSPKSREKIRTDESKEAKVGFAWKESPGVSRYRVEVSDAQDRKIATEEIQGGDWKLSLKVGAKYHWTVTGISEDGVEGDPMGTPREFTLMGGALAKPKIVFQSGEPSTGASWELPPHAETSDVTVQLRPVGSAQWKSLKSIKTSQDHETAFDSQWASGRLRMGIRAHGALRRPSEWAYEEIDYKMSSIVEEVQQGERGRMVGGFAPLFMHYSLYGPRVQQFQFDAVISSSYFVSGQWWFSKNRKWGLDVFGHRARTTLFNTQKTGANASSDQPPLPVEISEVSLGARYRIADRPWTWDLKLGFTRRAAMTFYAEKPTVMGAVSNSVTELMLGTMVSHEIVFGVSWVADVDVGQSLGATGMTLKACRHERLALGLTRHMFFMPKVLLGAHYQLDNTEYDFQDKVHGLDGTMSALYHRVMVSLGYIF